MNSVLQTQANTLIQMCPNNTQQVNVDENDLKAHLYLEAMQLPLDVQDNILNAIHRLGSVNTEKIGNILEHCSFTTVSERLLH